MNNEHKQYEKLIIHLDKELGKPKTFQNSLSSFIDNFVTASFWNEQGKINWKQPWKSGDDSVPDNWTIMDETVMLLDGLHSYQLTREMSRNLGVFVLNLQDYRMRAGSLRRWQDLCDKTKRNSHFYSHELRMCHIIMREHSNYLLKMFARTKIELK